MDRLENPRQDRRQNRRVYFVVASVLFCFVFILSCSLLPNKTEAVLGLGDVVSDPVLEVLEIKEATERAAEKVQAGWLQALKQGSALAFKNALKVFFGRMAQTTAEWVASGGESQSPLIYFESWDSFVSNAGDAMLGDFLQTLATQNGLLSFNLCSPSASFNINLGWMMINALEPREPECTFNQMTNNWAQAAKDPDFLKNFAVSWGPDQNPLGVTLSAQGTLYEMMEEKKMTSTFERLSSQFKDVTSGVADYIETPGTMVANQVFQAQNQSTSPYIQYTGEIAADTLDIFSSTLVSKLMERMQGGMFSLADLLKQKNENEGTDWFGSYSSTGSSIGQQAAVLNFADIGRPSLNEGNQFSVLDEMSYCPDNSEDRTVLNCTISSGFRTAIEQQMTVGEAISAGYLNGSKKFAFGSQGSIIDRPEDGYSYHAIVVLKKYRIVPVGWQVAAEYIKDFQKGDYSLGQLVEASTQCAEDNYSPFCGLVNPDWVLKAPDNYCKKLGYGETLSSDDFLDDSNKYTPRERMVNRQEVCVDDQSCLAEDSEGSCIAYGYCTKDVKTYSIDGKQCDEQYSSCLGYTKKETKEKYNYLASNLNFSNCDSSNAGCAWYCRSKDENGVWNCTAPEKGKTINFDQEVKTCKEGSAGCTAFSRTTFGANLIANGSIEYASGTCQGGDDEVCQNNSDCSSNICLFKTASGWGSTGSAEFVNVSTVNPYGGSKALEVNGSASSVAAKYSFDTGYALKNRTFKVSLYANTSSDADCKNGFSLEAGTGTPIGSVNWYRPPFTTADSSWHEYSYTKTFSNSAEDSTFTLYISGENSCSLLVDNVVVEEFTPAMENAAAIYSEYAKSNDLIYLTGKRLACTAEEVGCELYTPKGKDATYAVPAKITNPLSSACTNAAGEADYSKASCSQCTQDMVGCDFFEESALLNNPPDSSIAWRTGKYCSLNQTISCSADQDCVVAGQNLGPCLPSVSIIPTTGTKCSYEEAGCEEYTNLDKVRSGGEALEYYTAIKQCVKADDPAAQNYYTWEGSDTQGYQLKTFKLKKSNLNNGPCTNLEYTNDPNAAPPFDCVDGAAGRAAATCSQEEMATNPDCRQYFDQEQNIYYLLQSKTITVSDECHPMRNTIDSFIYYTIPSESKTCSAKANGCREYKGNAGYNIHEIVKNDFESGAAWAGGVISNESLQYGGHSLSIVGAADFKISEGSAIKGFSSSYALGSQLENGLSYSLNFWAKGKGKIWALFYSPTTKEKLFFNFTGISLTDEWQSYSLGPLIFDHAPAADEALVFISEVDQTETKGAYLDNIVLRSNENFYLVKGSSALCKDYEGCRQYQDRAGKDYYLKSFSSLCASEKVGCEALINTYNSDYPWQEEFQSENNPPYDSESDDVVVPSDKVELFVNNKDNYCQESDKGCEKLGQPEINETTGVVEAFKDVYLINDPDSYETILCQDSEMSCKEYRGSDGATYYFKDPGNRVCEYKATRSEDSLLTSLDYSWYIKDTNGLCPVSDEEDVYSQPVGAVCFGGTRSFRSCNYDYDCPDGICTSYVPYGDDIDSFGICGYGETTGVTPIEPPSLKVCDENAQCQSGEVCYKILRKGMTCQSGQSCLTISDFYKNVCGMSQTPAELLEICSNKDYFTKLDEKQSTGWVGLCPEGQNGCTKYLDPDGENLVANFSFETDVLKNYRLDSDKYIAEIVDPVLQGSDKIPDGFVMMGDFAANDVCAFERTTAEKKDGLYSMLIRLTGLPSDINKDNLPGCGLMSRDWITISRSKATEVYTVGAWVKASSGTPRITLGLHFSGISSFDPNKNWSDLESWGSPIAAYEQLVPTDVSEDGWVYYSGTVGPFEKYSLPVSENGVVMKFAIFGPLFNEDEVGSSLYIDNLQIKHSVEYNYIDKTVNGTPENGNSQCSTVDPDITNCVAFRDTSRRTQSLSIDGSSCSQCVINHADDTKDCSGEADTCQANTIIKVSPNRECDNWLACETYRQTEDTAGNLRSVCFSVNACDELSPAGVCSSFLPRESYTKSEPLMFESWAGNTDQLYLIKNLTGYVKVGLLWEPISNGSSAAAKLAQASINTNTGYNPYINQNQNTNTGGDLTSNNLFYLPYKMTVGYYPIQDMFETGLSSSGAASDLVKNGDFESFYCIDNNNKGKILACVSNAECAIVNLDEEGNEVPTVGQCSNRNESINGEMTKGTANIETGWVDYPSGPIFGQGQSNPTGDTASHVDFMNYDPTVKAASSSNQADGAQLVSTEAVSPYDLNNVLKFEPQKDTPESGAAYIVGENLNRLGNYTLSFDARLVSGAVSDAAAKMKVGVAFFDVNGDGIGKNYFSRVCSNNEDLVCTPDIPQKGMIAINDISCQTFDPFTIGSCNKESGVALSTEWQKFILGPITIEMPVNVDFSRTRIYFTIPSSLTSGVMLDNVSLKPVLRTADLSSIVDDRFFMDKTALRNADNQGGIISVARSCRAYPASNSLRCTYYDKNGRAYQGWKGYCLESDPANPNNCVMWYPVDIISAESDLYSKETAGYTGVAPLYYCLAAKGLAPYIRGDLDAYPTAKTDHAVSYNSKNKKAIIEENGACLKNSKWHDSLVHYCAVGEEARDKSFGIKISDINGRAAGVEKYSLPSSLNIMDVQAIHIENRSTSSGTIRDIHLDRNGCWLRKKDSDHSGNPWDGQGNSANTYGCFTGNVNSDDVLEEGEDNFCGYDSCETDLTDAETKSIKYQWFYGINDSSYSNGYRVWVNLTEAGEIVNFVFNIKFGGDKIKDADLSMYVILRDHCTQLVKTVDLDGTNYAWATRLNSSSTYAVSYLGYRYLSDYQPYGSVTVPLAASSPEAWGSEPIIVEQADTKMIAEKEGGDLRASDFKDPYQIRAASPYGCEGTCEGGAICVGRSNKLGQSCYQSDRLDQFCESYASSWWGDGITDKDSDSLCVGSSSAQKSSGDLDHAVERLEQLFVKPLELWEWDDGKYKKVDDGNDNFTQWQDDYEKMPECGVDSSVAGIKSHEDRNSSKTYCGFSPKVLYPSINNSGSLVEVDSGSMVSLSFGSYVDADQLPLKTIIIDWQDGSPLTVDPWNANTKSIKSPHVYTHAYTFAGPEEFRTFTPKVRIIDNWGWCSGNSDENKNRFIGGEGTPITEGCDTWSDSINEVKVRRQLPY